MTFDELLVQVLALLQREQRRFALEKADLEALKDELIYAKRLAVDEDSRVLVWAGAASPPLAGQVAGAAGGYEPRQAVAAPGEARRGP
jgi:hypothetical protein